MTLSGGCYCGDIRYETDGTPFHETVCHCSICRRLAGAPMVGWFSVKRGDFRLTCGTPQEFRSPHATRSFCPRCGSQLTFANDQQTGEIDITIASLDDPNAVPPRDHCYLDTRLAWVKLADGLPERKY